MFYLQAMSLSTPDSERVLKSESDDIQSDFDSANDDSTQDSGHVTQSCDSSSIDCPPATTIHNKNVFSIEPDPNSCISDYSEMADPIKEHLGGLLASLAC